MNILVVRLSSLGDVVDSLWALSIMREYYPAAQIDFVVEDRFADVLANHPHIDNVIVFPRGEMKRAGMFAKPSKLLRFIGKLRAAKYDAVFDLQHNLKSGAISWLTKSKRRVGFDSTTGKEKNWIFQTERYKVFHEGRHRAETFEAFIHAAGVDEERRSTAKPLIFEDAKLAAEVRKSVESKKTRAGPVIISHPTVSKYNSYKQWDLAKFAQVYDRLIDEFGANVILSLGPREEDDERAIREAMKNDLPEACYLSIRGETELLRACDMFLACDTGSVHIASATKTPTVAIFGPKDSVLHGPHGVLSRVVELRELSCKPCRDRACVDPVCIRGISAGMVFNACASLLAELRFVPAAETRVEAG
ncbi:MAG: glycosyltransferase family 9 protein [Planctomycetes bacterium]|nr:glycosyltransferase family 9 protein [Planctomycetota bacterium]